MKFLIFDAGPLISLSMSGLLYIIERLRKDFDGEFIITPFVKREVIDRPLKNKKYELGGIRILDLLNKGILKMSTKFVKDHVLERETNKILDISNSAIFAEKNISLVQEGEASCLAFSKICNCDNVIVIDERTMRMLIEDPEGLKKLMENKLHTSIKLKKSELKELKNIKFIRSTELVYIAYQKDLLNLKKEKETLEAMLYALKFNGAAISEEEIIEIKQLAT